MAQSVERLTSAQVVISRFVSLSPVLGSVLTAQSLELASDSVSPALSAPSLFTLSLSVSKMNKYLKIFYKNKEKKQQNNLLSHISTEQHRELGRLEPSLQ